MCVCVCLPNYIYTTLHTTRWGEKKMWSTFHLIQYEAYIRGRKRLRIWSAFTSTIEFFFLCQLYIYYCIIVKNSVHDCFILLKIMKPELKSKTIQAKTNKQTTITTNKNKNKQQTTNKQNKTTTKKN